MAPSGNEFFPTLLSCTALESKDCIYDVKFYPFETANNEQIFAVVAERHTIIYRTKLGANPPFEILQWLRDDSVDIDDKPASSNSIVWTTHPSTKKPLLCIAGHVPRHIKIVDVESGEVIRTLPGHGRGINDLAISPLSNSILASCAEDNTIRIWNLEEDHEEQPCVALLAGEGHKSPVLAIHFHPNGRWLLSGGIDTAVCLWAVPDLADLRRDPKAEDKEPKIVYYPLFFTKELHSNYVDCLAFYGDLIISRAAGDSGVGGDANEILIWEIDGFESDEPAPLDPPIPEPGKRSRSAFPHDKGFRGFQRLLTLNMPHSDRFYHRFGLLQSPGMRPILAMGNQISEYYFWDLQQLEEGIEVKKGIARARKPKAGRAVKLAPSAESLNRLDNIRRSESAGGSPSVASRSYAPIKFEVPVTDKLVADPSSAGQNEREYTLNDRFKLIEPHFKRVPNTSVCGKNHFATSQIAWSPNGTWMVAVGDYGVMCMLHRDQTVVGIASQRDTNGDK